MWRDVLTSPAPRAADARGYKANPGAGALDSVSVIYMAQFTSVCTLSESIVKMGSGTSAQAVGCRYCSSRSRPESCLWKRLSHCPVHWHPASAYESFMEKMIQTFLLRKQTSGAPKIIFEYHHLWQQRYAALLDLIWGNMGPAVLLWAWRFLSHQLALPGPQTGSQFPVFLFISVSCLITNCVYATPWICFNPPSLLSSVCLLQKTPKSSLCHRGRMDPTPNAPVYLCILDA